MRRAISLSLLGIFCRIFLLGPCFASSVHQEQHAQSFGIAWGVQGSWKSETQDQFLATGDVIVPGTLVHPAPSAGNHSVLIFLPDGQRILYECYLPEDCAHSFRVPSLNRTPDAFAADLIARIHQVLSSRQNFIARWQESLPRDGVLAELAPSHQVSVGGLAAALPNGDYTYNLRPLDQKIPRQSRVALKKTSNSISLKLPSVGIYDMLIFDSLNTPRIDLLIAAVDPEHEVALSKSFTKAKELLADWNEDYQGWPVHDFQRAYLESLFSNSKPHVEEVWPVVIPARREVADDVTTEPDFLPPPGLYEQEMTVALACRTPHAAIHYTIDGSQPLRSSPVYSGPITVKATLIIKAFASAPGKKDSAVVTGIFRMGD